MNGTPAADLSELRGLPVMAVSSLGDPASFEATLRNLGALVTPRRFADHHRYAADDVREVEESARQAGLRIVTTAKDAVKIRAFATPDDWWVLDIALAVDEEASFRTWVLKTAREYAGKE